VGFRDWSERDAPTFQDGGGLTAGGSLPKCSWPALGVVFDLPAALKRITSIVCIKRAQTRFELLHRWCIEQVEVVAESAFADESHDAPNEIITSGENTGSW
jgi:hypothetical protein